MNKDDKKIIKEAIAFFNKRFSNLEPLEWSDFKPNSKYFAYYIGHVTDNGNVSLMFPISVTPDLAHIVLSTDNKILKTNKALDAELKSKELKL